MGRKPHAKPKRDPRRPRRVGASPGSIHVDPNAPRPVVTFLAYGPEGFTEGGIPDHAETPELDHLLKSFAVTWLNVDGLGDAAILEGIGRRFELHPLILEDIINVTQRPKVETYGDRLFIVARMPLEKDRTHSEQVSLIVSRGTVLSFQEVPGDCLGPVRDRIRQKRPRISGAGADYLGYAILDAIVDAYFPTLDSIGDDLEEIEERVLAKGDDLVVGELHRVKARLTRIRRMVLPLREALGQLMREDSDLITEETRVFLRDTFDHTVQLMELVEAQRDIASGILDLHLTLVSNRMNDIMKVLTIIATIFIPLGFIAGLYGMNFDPGVSRWNMPELSWPFGYPFALFLMGGMAFVMVLFFRRKGWL